MMYDDNNIFAKIIAGEIPAKKIYEDIHLIAFEDINPASAVHVLVIPKGRYTDYTDFVTNASNADIVYYFQKITEIVRLLGLEKGGYRLVMNKGPDSGQVVFHFHTHIIGGNKLN